MIHILAFIVYLIVAYIGFKFMIKFDMWNEEDKRKPLNFKHKILAILWITLFLTSQILWIAGILDKFLFT